MKRQLPYLFFMVLISAFIVQSSTLYLTPGTLNQSAIDALPDGSTIILQDGNYLLTQAIKLNGKINISIIGQSGNNTISFNQTCYEFNLVDILNCQNITIQNLNFKGTIYTVIRSDWHLDYSNGIFINQATNISVKNCSFADRLGCGIYAHASVLNSSFSNNFFYGYFLSGICLKGGSCINDTISNSMIDFDNGLGSMGIWIVDGANNNHIISNIIKGCNAEAIICEGPGTARNTISSNAIDNCSYGIVLRCHSAGIVDGNSIKNCPTVGIQLMPESTPNNATYEVTDNIVSNNLIINCGTMSPEAAAISAGTWVSTQICKGNTITSNTILGGKTGVFINNVKSCAVFGNNIGENPSVGINIKPSYNSTIQVLNNNVHTSSSWIWGAICPEQYNSANNIRVNNPLITIRSFLFAN